MAKRITLLVAIVAVCGLLVFGAVNRTQAIVAGGGGNAHEQARGNGSLSE